MLVENDREDEKIWKRLCVKQEDTFSLGGRNGRAREDLVVGLENINYGRRTIQEQSQEQQRRGRGLLGRETKPSASFSQNREDEKKLSKGWRKRRRNYLNSFDGITRKLVTPLNRAKKSATFRAIYPNQNQTSMLFFRCNKALLYCMSRSR